MFNPVNLIDFSNGVKTTHRVPNNLLEDMVAEVKRLPEMDRHFTIENVMVYQRDNFGYFVDIELYQTDYKISKFDRNLLEFA